jgi:hypothetical protein
LAAKDLFSSPYQLILIYINEAHTREWPIGGLPRYDPEDEEGLRESVDQPGPQVSIEDRYDRMKALAAKLPPSLLENVTWCLDTWCPPDDFVSPTFENLYRAWPDRFVRLDSEGKIVEMTTYGNPAEENAALTNDYVEYL